MLSSSIFTDLEGNELETEVAVSMPSNQVIYKKRNPEIERLSNQFLVTSTRMEAACMIILDKKRVLKKITEKDMINFRSNLREYLYLKDEIINKETSTQTYIIRDNSFLVMTLYRVAYLVKKTCRCSTIRFGKRMKLGYFADYDFGTGHLIDKELFNRLELKLLKGFVIDPKLILKLSALRIFIEKLPEIKSGKNVYMK